MTVRPVTDLQSSAGPVALRMDDVGASSKKYEVYSTKKWRFRGWSLSGNWLFLKYLPGIKSWGPYREIKAEEWLKILELLQKKGAKLTVAVTASWVEGEFNAIPFPKRFPDSAEVLREGVQAGLVEIANHGLSHCIVANNAFKPQWFSGNRQFHREFGPSVRLEFQDSHLEKSQRILQSWFGTDIVTFVPPGNIFVAETLMLARKHGLRYVSCAAEPNYDAEPAIVGNLYVAPFHDRDIVFGGINWLRDLLDLYSGQRFRFVKELAEEMKGSNGR